MNSRLYAILDVDLVSARGWAPLDVADVWLAAGVRLMQLRAKALASGPLQALADALVARAQTVGAQVIINDRADIAALSGADGVHVGQDDLAPAAVRTIVGPEMVVGLSTHDDSQVVAAVGEPVSYVAIGPVFGTRTKDTGYGAVGLGQVTRAAAIVHAAGLSLVAIGGITRGNARDVLDAGADSVAVISDLLPADESQLAARAHEWRRLLSGRL